MCSGWNMALLNLPDVQYDALEVGGEGGCADEEGIVEPGVLAVAVGLELRSGPEVELRIAFLVLAGADDATVADVDVDAVVGLDGVDGLQFGAVQAFVAQLIVGAAVQDGSFQQGAFEGASRDGDDGPSAVLGVAYALGFAEGDFQLHGKLQFGCIFRRVVLCAGYDRHRC